MTVAPTPLVTLDGVGKRWDATARLAPVDVTIRAGELVVVQGRSGTGKSTLIAILAGWCRPDEGTVTWSHDARAADGGAGWSALTVVPQLLATDDDLLVTENVQVVVRDAGASAPVADARAADVLRSLDLAELGERWPRELSTGQRQRLAVARAVAGSPRVVLADEPTSHQDGEHADVVMDVLRAAVEGGAGALITSHDPAVARHAGTILTLT